MNFIVIRKMQKITNAMIGFIYCVRKWTPYLIIVILVSFFTVGCRPICLCYITLGLIGGVAYSSTRYNEDIMR
ncbi:MAG: hypothetical protein Nk1A_4110 [Endomicrobiia bacterium]|nr:MAG: hypothetical protein Nk1A_4110 [Endomicrobiia bacterium]